jgi:hypothetical protein
MRNYALAIASVLALSVMALLPATAVRALEEDSGMWTTLTVVSPTWEKFRADLLLQVRTRDDMSEVERYLVNPAISYIPNERFSFALGYDAHFVRNPIKTDEQRSWQQAMLSTPFVGLGIHHRLRLEERFFQGQGQDDVPVRLRYLIQVRTPEILASFVPKVHLLIREEAFFNLNEPSKAFEAGFAENRAFLGFQRPFAGRISFELGYQAQYLRRKTEDVLNHALMVGFGVQL